MSTEQRYSVTLTLSNREIEVLLFAFENDTSSIANHIRCAVELKKEEKE